MLYLLAKLIPFKVVVVLTLAVVLYGALGGDPVGLFMVEVVEPILTGIEDWLQSLFPW